MEVHQCLHAFVLNVLGQPSTPVDVATRKDFVDT